MSKTARSGAAALLLGPLIALIANIVVPTVSEDASDRVGAITAHGGAMNAALVLQPIGIACLIGGLAWLAITLAPAAPRLALAGGVLGVLGALIVLFVDGVDATAPAVVNALGADPATTALDRIHSSAATAVEPLSLLLFVGLIVLGVAAVKAGAPRWVAAVVAAGAVVAGVGLPAGVRPLIVVAFAVLLVGLAFTVRSLAGGTADSAAHEAVALA